MFSLDVNFQTTRSTVLLGTVLALEGRWDLFDVGKFEGQAFWIWMVLALVLHELFFCGPANVHSTASNLSTAVWFFMSIGVFIKKGFAGEAFMEVVACMSRAFVVVLAVVLLKGLLGV